METTGIIPSSVDQMDFGRASVWKWYCKSAILPLFKPRLTSSGTKKLTSPARLKNPICISQRGATNWLNSSTCAVVNKKGHWSGSHKNLGSDWFHYLAAVMPGNLHFEQQWKYTNSDLNKVLPAKLNSTHAYRGSTLRQPWKRPKESCTYDIYRSVRQILEKKLWKLNDN